MFFPALEEMWFDIKTSSAGPGWRRVYAEDPRAEACLQHPQYTVVSHHVPYSETCLSRTVSNPPTMHWPGPCAVSPCQPSNSFMALRLKRTPTAMAPSRPYQPQLAPLSAHHTELQPFNVSPSLFPQDLGCSTWLIPHQTCSLHLHMVPRTLSAALGKLCAVVFPYPHRRHPSTKQHNCVKAAPIPLAVSSVNPVKMRSALADMGIFD